jgi:hypothetical protein
MKSFKSIQWVALAMLATAALAVQGQLTIRRELKEGSTETYKVEREIKQIVEVPSMGEQDMILTTVATVAVKTNKVNAEKGSADVETFTKVEKHAMDGSIASMMGSQASELPKPKTEKGTLDVRNRLVIAKDPKAAPAGGGMGAMMGMSGMGPIDAQQLLTLIELPEKPVQIGDEIPFGLPAAATASSAGLKDLKLAMKVVGEKEVDGQKLWVVTYTGSFKLDLDTSKLPKKPDQPENPMGDITLTGSATIGGEGLVDQASGKTVANQMNIKNDIKVFLQQMGMEMPARGTISVKVSLLK